MFNTDRRPLIGVEHPALRRRTARFWKAKNQGALGIPEGLTRTTRNRARQTLAHQRVAE